MAVQVRYYTDPACPWSWVAEPVVRRLSVEFGDTLSWTYVMGGLARDYTGGGAGGQGHPGGGNGGMQAVYPRLVRHWLDAADAGAMPLDPRLWDEGPIASTYPACMAVKAASEQGEEAAGRYLRTVREGLMCFRRKLDTTEALVEEARRAGLAVDRFRVDLGSHAIVEAFGADLEEVRDPPEEARAAAGGVMTRGDKERISFPSMLFVGDGGRHGVWGPQPYESYRAAALAAGAEALADGAGRPGVLDALRRFGRMATREVEEACGLPGPRASAELWRLATEWQVKPTRVLTGELWELP